MSDELRTPVAGSRWLFWTCFISLVATSFSFILRAFAVEAWGVEFDLSETQKGELLGVGLWPFAISIVLFSLVVDRIGYGKALAFAWACHVTSVLLTIFAKGYWGLYAGTFINAIANGTVEAVINPVVATMFVRNKTKWLNILHAGWPGGIMLGGLLTLSLTPDGVLAGLFDNPVGWRTQFLLILVPTGLYGLMLLRARFPVSERVAAGVSYRAMLQEAGVIGMYLVTLLIVWEVCRVVSNVTALFHADGLTLFQQWDWQVRQVLTLAAVISAVLIVPFAIYVCFAPGRWLFILLLLVMIPLATTELGTDAWMKELMETVMRDTYGLSGLWVLIYSATIMTVLRFGCGPVVKALSPLGVLAMSAAMAAIGIAAMSQVSAMTGAALLIPLATTIYGIGQTFFWPTTLGVVSERFPRGGALTLNAIAGVGMLGVGIIGTQFMGFVQDQAIHRQMRAADAALHATVMDEPKDGLFGRYQPLDSEKVAALPADDAAVVKDAKAQARRTALLTVAALPVGMCVLYLLLIAYFRMRGGYQAEVLAGHAAPDGKTYTGGVTGPVE